MICAVTKPPVAMLKQVLIPFADAVPWPVIVVADSGAVLYVNEALRDAAPSADGSPRSLEQLFPEYFEALQGEVPWLTPQNVAVARHRAGRVIHERVWVRPLPKGACLIIMDETRQRELEVGHAQTARLASLGFMLASVSHEISNPLAAIRSILQILQSKRGESPATVQKGLVNIAISVRRILSISRKLNLFARVGDESASAFSVDTAIEEAVALFGYDSLGETVEVNHQPDPTAMVWGYPGQLQQVFYNLFLNAAQAMKGIGTIHVATQRLPPAHIEVLIHDTGPGLLPEHLQRIFEPFFTTKPGGEGTGLGLAISLEIVHEHGGTIDAESAPGGGARFRIRLPRHVAGA